MNERLNKTMSISAKEQSLVAVGNHNVDRPTEMRFQQTSPYGQPFLIESVTNKGSNDYFALPRIKPSLPKTLFNITDHNTPFVSTQLTSRRASNKISETLKGQRVHQEPSIKVGGETARNNYSVFMRTLQMFDVKDVSPSRLRNALSQYRKETYKRDYIMNFIPDAIPKGDIMRQAL